MSCGWIWAPCTRAKSKSTTSCPTRIGKPRWGERAPSSVWCSAQMWSDVSFTSPESCTFLWFPFLRTLPEADHHSHGRWVAQRGRNKKTEWGTETRGRDTRPLMTWQGGSRRGDEAQVTNRRQQSETIRKVKKADTEETKKQTTDDTRKAKCKPK